MNIPNGDYVKSYKSGNTRIFTVNQAGKLTAKKAGTAKLTATLASGKKITVKVIVQKGKVTAKKKGAAKITVKSGKKTVTCKVKVY